MCACVHQNIEGKQEPAVAFRYATVRETDISDCNTDSEVREDLAEV